MASFKGNEFAERGQGAQMFDTWSREADISEIHIPGGNTTVIQSAGLSADKLALRIRCTREQLDALRNVVGTSGSLAFSYGTRTAFLRSVSDVQEILASGKYFATLNLIGQ